MAGILSRETPSDDRAEHKDRQVNGYHESANQHPKYRHDYWLRQRAQPAYRIVDSRLIVVGRFAQHIIFQLGRELPRCGVTGTCGEN